MTSRIERLMQNVSIVRDSRIPVGIEKARHMTESFRATEGQPHILRCARAFAHVIERATLFIADDELIVGNPASQPWGVELTPVWGTWPEDEIASLEEAGYRLHPDVRAEIGELNDYWAGRSLTSLMTSTYDDARLWPYAQLGVVLPAFRSKEEGWGAGGLLGGGYGIQHEISQMIATPDFARVLEHGLGALLEEARERERATRLFSDADFERLDFYRAAILAIEAVQRLIERFGETARADAEKAAPQRRAELLEIAGVCEHIRADGARTFREAVQLYWFVYLSMLPSGTLGMGRLDQLLLPWYSRDRAAGRVQDEEVVELLAMLRLRSMEITVQGGTAHRSKWAGGSKWHNAVIGGVTADGADATNPLSYLLLRAAEICPTPHHTLTLRVHEGTPSGLIQAGLRLARTGLGMPAFVSDEANIRFLEAQGIDTESARDYNMAGSQSVTVTGKSRLVASPMFVMPRVLGIAVQGGAEGVGPRTPTLGESSDFETFFDGFTTQLGHMLELQAEFNNVTIRSIGHRYPRPFDSVLMKDGLELGVDVYRRTLPYDNSNFVNLIGVVNTADALVAIKRLVFEERAVTADRLIEALERNWDGPGDEELRQRFLAAPKFGNDIDEVDHLVAKLYEIAAERIVRYGNATGGSCLPSALTIGTSPWPGGVVSGATADGRRREEPLAEESMTPMRGRERGTPWDVIASALKVAQDPYQSTELDIRFTRRALSTDAAMTNLEDLIRTYLGRGGKHIQINVADLDELRRASDDPDNHPDVTVRLGGTTAYVAQLSPAMREEIMARHYFAEMPARS